MGRGTQEIEPDPPAGEGALATAGLPLNATKIQESRALVVPSGPGRIPGIPFNLDELGHRVSAGLVGESEFGVQNGSEAF